MNLSQKVIFTFKAIRKVHSYKSIMNAILIYKKEGLVGLKKAILKKAVGNEVLRIENNEHLIKEDNKFGNRVLRQQQEEIDIELYKRNIASWDKRPLISVVMPIYNPPIKWLKIAIESLQNQIYTNWELCAVDDGSTNFDGIKLLEDYAKSDERIRLYKSEKNRGISKASNKAIDMASGEYIALLDQDDELLIDSFYWFIEAINKNSSVDFLYSDECKIREDTSREGFEFLFKADWDPYLLINNMFIGHLVMYKTELLKKYGGFNSDFDFGQDYELAMRIGSYAKSIIHIPRILYFWRALPTSTAAGGKIFSNKINMAVPCKWLKKQGIYANIRKNMHYNYPIIIGNSKLVSIIEAPITMNSFENSIEDIINNTSYKNYEIIIVAERNILLEIEEKYPYLINIYFIEVSKDTSILERFNIASEHSNGEVLVFMNSSCFPVNKEWLDRLVDVLQFPGIGAVSPVILDEKK
ncbi:glycosyltransferase [Megamonas sp.]